MVLKGWQKLPGRSEMSNTPQLSHKTRILQDIRQVLVSRSLNNISREKNSNSSHGDRQDSSSMSLTLNDTSHNNTGLSCSSSSSSGGQALTPRPTTIRIAEKSTALNEKITKNVDNSETVSSVPQSSVQKTEALLKDKSSIQEISDHLPMKSIASGNGDKNFTTNLHVSNPSNPSWKVGFDFWGKMPCEIAILIFSYFLPKQLIRLSIVSKFFRRICYDGQLWTSFDASNFYKEIPAESLAKILVAAGPFVKDLNLRGCIQIEYYKRAEVIVKACHNLVNATLEGCRNFQRTTLHSLLVYNNSLVRLNLTGLPAVTNETCKIIAQNCPSLESLNVSWCMRMDTRGIRIVVQACTRLKHLRAKEIKGFDSIDLARDIFESNMIETFVVGGCTDLTDKAIQTMIYGENPEIDILTNIPLVPARKILHFNISRCNQITDQGIKALSHLTPDLNCLILSGCSRIGDDGLKAVLTTTPYLRYLDLEEVSRVTNDFFKETLAKTNCASAIYYLSISYCHQLDDTAMIPILRAGKNLWSVQMDNTGVSDLVLTEAANFLQSRFEMRMKPITHPEFGIDLAVFDCPNITWVGIREVMSHNSNVHRFTDDGRLIYASELIHLRCHCHWQLTVEEHTKRIVRGNQQAARKLEKLWTEWMMANEELGIQGPGMRRRRRRAIQAVNLQQNELSGRIYESRRRSRIHMTNLSCAIM